MSEQNKLAARQFVERFLNTADPAVLDDLTTPGYIDHDLPSGITPRQSVTVFRAAFPDARFTVEDVIGESDRVAVRYRSRARIPATSSGCRPAASGSASAASRSTG